MLTLKVSRRSFGAVRQRCRSGEGEGRGGVSELLHCLFTLIDDWSTPLHEATDDGRCPVPGRGGCRGGERREGRGKRDSARTGKMGGFNFYLAIPLERNAADEGSCEGRADTLLYSLCRSYRPRNLATSSRRCTACHKEYKAAIPPSPCAQPHTNATNSVTGNRRAHSSIPPPSPPPPLAAGYIMVHFIYTTTKAHHSLPGLSLLHQ